MKTLLHALAAALLLPVWAAAQARPSTVEELRRARQYEERAREFEEESRGIDADTLGFGRDGVMSGAPPRQPGRLGPAPTVGPAAGTVGPDHQRQNLVTDLEKLRRLALDFRSYRFAPLDEPWVRRHVRETSDELEKAAGGIYRAVTGRDPGSFEYDRAAFAARPLEEQLVMVGNLAARTLSDIIRTLDADTVDAARQTRIASRLNILWELGRYLRRIR